MKSIADKGRETQTEADSKKKQRVEILNRLRSGLYCIELRVRVNNRVNRVGVRVGVRFNRVRGRFNRRETKVNVIERETDKNRRRNGKRQAQR